LFFYSPKRGRDKHVDVVLAKILQRNHNDQAFSVNRIDIAARPDLAARVRIRDTPAILIVEGDKVAARAQRPKGRPDLTELMAPWLDD
jgi:hypothetical protein